MTFQITEDYVELNTVDIAESFGWWAQKMAWPGRRNAPDHLFVKAGRYVWIEFKRPGEPARKGQLLEHGRMRKFGMEVHVCDNIASALTILGIPTCHDPTPQSI